MNQFLGVDDEDSYYVTDPAWHKRWHIDGFPDAIKGLKSGEVRNFTMLIGIILSEVPEDYMGNFTVYPAGHHLLEKYFTEQGGVHKVLEGTTFEGIMRVVNSVQNDMPAPVQIKGKPGDIILAHYQLPHNIAPNLSSNIRYACYFRLHNIRHQAETPRPEALTSMFIDYDGIRDITGAPIIGAPTM